MCLFNVGSTNLSVITSLYSFSIKCHVVLCVSVNKHKQSNKPTQQVKMECGMVISGMTDPNKKEENISTLLNDSETANKAAQH